jgi:hypothetical protein
MQKGIATAIPFCKLMYVSNYLADALLASALLAWIAKGTMITANNATTSSTTNIISSFSGF